jgi:hypothetical protein
MKHNSDGSESIGILPENWELLHLLGADEEVLLFTGEVMQEG